MTLSKDNIYSLSDTIEKKIMKLTDECVIRDRDVNLFNRIVSL